MHKIQVEKKGWKIRNEERKKKVRKKIEEARKDRGHVEKEGGKKVRKNQRSREKERRMEVEKEQNNE